MAALPEGYEVPAGLVNHFVALFSLHHARRLMAGELVSYRQTSEEIWAALVQGFEQAEHLAPEVKLGMSLIVRQAAGQSNGPDNVAILASNLFEAISQKSWSDLGFPDFLLPKVTDELRIGIIEYVKGFVSDELTRPIDTKPPEEKEPTEPIDETDPPRKPSEEDTELDTPAPFQEPTR